MRMPFTWANCNGGISIIATTLLGRALDVGGRRREGRLQHVELLRQHVAEHLYMRDDVGSRNEAEIELIAIALHGDVERDAMSRDRHREDVQQPRTRRI